MKKKNMTDAEHLQDALDAQNKELRRVSGKSQTTGSKKCKHKWALGRQDFEGWCVHWCSKCGALRETQMQPNGKEKSTFHYVSNASAQPRGD